MLGKFSKHSVEPSWRWESWSYFSCVRDIQKFFSWINLRLKVSSLCLSGLECKQTTGCSESQVNVLSRDEKEPNRCRRIDSFFDLHGFRRCDISNWLPTYHRRETRDLRYRFCESSPPALTVFKISGITWPAEGIRRVNCEIAAKIAQRDLKATLNKAFLRVSFAEINFTSEKLKWNASSRVLLAR